MSPETLLRHFDRISEAPDAVRRLRRFVLDLAVRGKLVEQNSGDETAAVLFGRIEAQKQKLSRGSYSVEKPCRGISRPPFRIPHSWMWVRATEVAVLISDNGKKVQTKEVLTSGKYPIVDQGKQFIRGYCDDEEKVVRLNQPVIVFGDHTRETKLIDFDFVVGADGVKILKPLEVDPAYYFHLLQWVPLDNRGYGRHFKLLRAALIPLAPLLEQHRINAKVNELLALCDGLEAAHATREERRNRLVAATLHGLNNGAVSDGNGQSLSFQEAARFYVNHLPRVTSRSEHIQQFRQTVLNLALCGKLVRQDIAEGSGTQALEAARRAKQELMLARGIRREQEVEYSEPGQAITAPANWVWAHLSDVAIVQGGKRLPAGASFSKTQTPHIYIRVTNMKDGTILATDLKFITTDVQRAIAKYTIRALRRNLKNSWIYWIPE